MGTFIVAKVKLDQPACQAQEIQKVMALYVGSACLNVTERWLRLAVCSLAMTRPCWPVKGKTSVTSNRQAANAAKC